jgi:predicted nucleotidyltransferase
MISVDIEELRDIAAQFSGDERVIAIYLFGSVVTGRKSPSDIDICLITNEELGLKEELKIAVKFPDEADVVFFYRLPVKIKINVFRDGTPLLINDPEILDRIKIRTIKEHQDLYRWIRRYERRWFE